MGTLILVGQLFLSLSILIVLHEFGHFLPARLFNTRVEKFYLFFDPYFSLFKKKIGETEYGIGWLPLGGYVKISGMIDESMDREAMKEPPKPYEFRSKPSWQRLIIMLGGVTVNFLLGFLIYGMVLWTWGESHLPLQEVNDKYAFHADSFAMELGFMTGDKILSIDNQPVESVRRLRLHIFLNESKTAQVIRDGNKKEVAIPEALTGALASYKGRFLSPRIPFEADSVIAEMPAEKAGIKKNDKVISLDGQPIQFFDEFYTALRDKKEEKIQVGVLRNNLDTIMFDIKTTEDGTIGIAPYGITKHYLIDTTTYAFGSAMATGVDKSFEFLYVQINAFGQMFRGKVKATESFGGFGSIGGMFGHTWDWRNFWFMTAVLSLILGFMNLLPIPALDGGHVMFLLWEMITGRKPSDKFLEYATIVGFIIVLSLVLFANGLDILRALGWM